MKTIELLRKLIVLVFALRAASYRFPYSYNNEMITSGNFETQTAKGGEDFADTGRSSLLHWLQNPGSHLFTPKLQNQLVGVNVDIYVDPETHGVVKAKSSPTDNASRRRTSNVAGNELSLYHGSDVDGIQTADLRRNKGIELSKKFAGDASDMIKWQQESDIEDDDDGKMMELKKELNQITDGIYPNEIDNFNNNNNKEIELIDNNKQHNLNSRWNGIKKRQMGWIQDASHIKSWLNGDVNVDQTNTLSEDDQNSKRNALLAFKRLKGRPRQMQFVPSISVGSFGNLGGFFRNLADNMKFLEKSQFTEGEMKLMDGDHPVTALRDEILNATNNNNTKPTSTAAFLSAVRHYKPSERISTLVAMNPEGYHSSQYLDPNYHWIGLGK